MPELPHNAPPQPATPIGELSAWWLEIRCQHCRRDARLSLEYLATKHGNKATVGDVLRRLRCGRMRGELQCAGKPSTVTLVEMHFYGKSARRLREMLVMGATTSGR